MALRDAAQMPVNDPFGAISAIAAVTTNVCFGITATVTFEQLYILERRLSTLDHLTKGRAAWNVVSSYLNIATLNIGVDRQMAHDERYDMADEYMDVAHKLCEGFWEDGAVHRYKKAGIFTGASKVHPIRHDGKYFKVLGLHVYEPSPPRFATRMPAGKAWRTRRLTRTSLTNRRVSQQDCRIVGGKRAGRVQCLPPPRPSRRLPRGVQCAPGRGHF